MLTLFSTSIFAQTSRFYIPLEVQKAYSQKKEQRMAHLEKTIGRTDRNIKYQPKLIPQTIHCPAAKVFVISIIARIRWIK